MTSKENHLAKEIADLIKKIEAQRARLENEENFSRTELEELLSSSKSLYEKALILNYLNSTTGNQEISVAETLVKPLAEAENRPEAMIPPRKPEHITETKSLHEKISSVKSKTTLAEKLQKKSGKKLSSSIALHEKLMFQKELFGGNISDYNQAILHLEELTDTEQAKKYLYENFSSKNNWEKKEEAVNAFLALLEKHLG